MGDDLLFGEGMAYEWGTDWPEAFDVLSMSKQNRPLSRMLSPLGVMDELNKLYYMSRPRPGKPQGKPLPAPPHEGEMETESRKKAQKECQRMILPKGKKESPDLFLRRLDAHKIAPTALLVMQLPPEQDLDTVKRYIATKENESEGILVPPQWCRRRDAALPLARPRPLPLHLVSLRRHAQVLPKTAYETEAEYEARLALAKGSEVAVVIGKGENESADDFKLRLAAQAKAKAPLMPRAYGEPAASFKARPRPRPPRPAPACPCQLPPRLQLPRRRSPDRPVVVVRSRRRTTTTTTSTTICRRRR